MSQYNSRLALQMRFKDVDMFGHVNNTVYFEYMDLGKVNYINQVLGDLFNTRRDALVIANINCDFVRPTLPTESVAVETRVDSIGEHSLTLEQRIVNADTGDIKAQARVVMVGFDATTGTTKVIPDSWRQCISQFEGRSM